MEGGEEEEYAQEWQGGFGNNDEEDIQEDQWKDYDNGTKTNTEDKLESVEKIDTDRSGVSSWGASKGVAASEVVMKW